MSRTYKLDGKLFNGFNKDFSTPHRLVVTQDEDSFDLWAIDEVDVEDSIKELLWFFELSELQQKIIGTYTESGFSGFICPKDFVSRKSRFNYVD